MTCCPCRWSPTLSWRARERAESFTPLYKTQAKPWHSWSGCGSPTEKMEKTLHPYFGTITTSLCCREKADRSPADMIFRPSRGRKSDWKSQAGTQPQIPSRVYRYYSAPCFESFPAGMRLGSSARPHRQVTPSEADAALLGCLTTAETETIE